LIIPPLKIVEAGRENATFFAMLEANVRVPRQVAGDVRALAAGCRVMEAKLAEFLALHGMADLARIAQAIIAHSEATMRRGIAATIPEGTYRGVTTVDGFGDPLTIGVTVIARGGELEIDFAGSSPQSPLGINSTLVYTRVWATYIVKCLC